MIRYCIIALTALVVFSYGCREKPHAEPDVVGETRKPVVVSKAKVRTFEEQLRLSGNIEAKRPAMVAARTGGTIERIFVDEGAVVKAGETKLFETETVTLSETVTIATHQVSVADALILEKEANLARVKADFDKAKIDYERQQRLFQADATPKNVLEMHESRFGQLQASMEHAKTLVVLSKEQKKQAESQLAIAEKKLNDAVVIAPLSGVVTKRNYEPGERVNPGTVVLRIEDHSLLEIIVHVPSRYYARITEKRTKLRLAIDGRQIGYYPVSYKGRVVSANLRTFEVKCLIQDPHGSVVPGRLIQVTVAFGERQAIGVPATSIQTRGGKTAVFVVDGDRAKRIEVQPGLEIDGWIEIKSGNLVEGVRVISTGQDFVNDGDAVLVQEDGA